MSIGLVTSAILVVATIGTVVYLATGKQKSSSETKAAGVLISVRSDSSQDSKKTITTQLNNFFEEANFKKIVKGDHTIWSDNDGVGATGPSALDEKSDNHYYYGFFFENKERFNKCNSLSDKSKAVLYVGKNDSEKFNKSPQFTKWSEEGDNCSKENYAKAGSFWQGETEHFNSLGIIKDSVFQIL